MTHVLFLAVEKLRQYPGSPPSLESVLHLVYESAHRNIGAGRTARLGAKHNAVPERSSLRANRAGAGSHVGCSDDEMQPTWRVAGGNAQRGPALIQSYGCGACHTIPGVARADGNLGPPLAEIGERLYVAGVLRNTPDNLMHWIRYPQRVVPGNAMPNLGVTDQDARDIAAYLYTLR